MQTLSSIRRVSQYARLTGELDPVGRHHELAAIELHTYYALPEGEVF